MEFSLILLFAASADTCDALITTPLLGSAITLSLKGLIVYQSWHRYGFSSAFGKGKKQAIIFASALLADQAFGELPVLEFISPISTISVCVLEYQHQKKSSALFRTTTKLGEKKLPPNFLNAANRNAHLLKGKQNKTSQAESAPDAGDSQETKVPQKAESPQEAESPQSAPEQSLPQYHSVSAPNVIKKAPSISGAADSYHQKTKKAA